MQGTRHNAAECNLPVVAASSRVGIYIEPLLRIAKISYQHCLKMLLLERLTWRRVTITTIRCRTPRTDSSQTKKRVAMALLVLQAQHSCLIRIAILTLSRACLVALVA